MGTLQAKAVACGILLMSWASVDSFAQNKPVQRIEWGKIREAFLAYYASPSADTAQRIMAVMPAAFDNRGISERDYEQWGLTIREIEPGTYEILGKLLKSGNRYAIRIGLRTLVISDGGYAEGLCALISDSFIPNPIAFLEEVKACVRETDLGEIAIATVIPVSYAYNEDTKENREQFKKDVRSRIELLKDVHRQDLINVRDRCLRALRRTLKLIPG